MPIYRILCCMSVTCFLLAGCGASSSSRVPDLGDTQRAPTSQDAIADVARLPQDLNLYVQDGGQQRILSAEVQAQRDSRFNTLWFRTWHEYRPNKGVRPVPKSWRGSKPIGYAENLRPWTEERWTALLQNARASEYPSLSERGIVVRATPLRILPGNRPSFEHPTHPGKGFPFDQLQISMLPVGMPFRMTHSSADGAWVFVENALGNGWAATQDVARVPDSVVMHYESGRYAAFIADNVTLRDMSGTFLALVGVGTVLPVVRSSNDSWTVLVPVRSPEGTALLKEAVVPANVLVQKPMPLTAANVARVGMAFMGQPYGWGGAFENRDCSLMLQQLFTPFGIWLPRNSRAQAFALHGVSLEGLSPEMKKQEIRALGVPFASLIWLPGHITLYIGEKNGEPLLFHDMWGIRTDEGGKGKGRYVVGQTVITTTQPGRELPNATSGALLLDRAGRLSIID